MRRHHSQAGQETPPAHRHHRNREWDLAMQHAVYAQFTRPVSDPDQPGQQISYGELEQRLRGRAYRQAALAGHRSADP